MNKTFIKEKSWREFQTSGMLFFVNTLLQFMGWSLVFETDDYGNLIRVFPARSGYRGFSEKSTTVSHKRIADYLKQNAHNFEAEILEGLDDDEVILPEPVPTKRLDSNMLASFPAGTQILWHDVENIPDGWFLSVLVGPLSNSNMGYIIKL